MPYPISYIIENASQFSAADMTLDNLIIEDLTTEQLLEQLKRHIEYYIQSIFYTEKDSETKLRRDITKDPGKLAQLTGDINKHKMAFFGLLDLLKKRIDLSVANVSSIEERYSLVAKDNVALSQMLNNRLANEANSLLLSRLRALEGFNKKLESRIAIMEQICRIHITFQVAYIKSLINPEATNEPYNKIIEMLFLMGDYLKINEFSRDPAKCLLELSGLMHAQKKKIAEQEDTIRKLESSNKYFTNLFECDSSQQALIFSDLFDIKPPDELASSHSSSSAHMGANIKIPEDSLGKKRRRVERSAVDFDEEEQFNSESLEPTISTLVSSSSSMTQFSNTNLYSNVTTTTSSSSSSSDNTQQRLIRTNSKSILNVRVNDQERIHQHNNNEQSVLSESQFMLSFLGKRPNAAAWPSSVKVNSNSSSAPAAKRARNTNV